MTTPTADSLVAELPEPVRRYLQHALPNGFQVTRGVTLRMTGKIRIGVWLPFTAVQACDGRSFEWRARVGLGRLAPFEVVDRYASGAGSVTGRLLGRFELFHQADEHVHRSAAGRAALEAVLAPASLLPGRGVSWRAEDDEHIVACSDLEPEHVAVHMRIDPRGALRAISARRWGNIGEHSYGYLTFGGDVHAEQRFGDLVIPSHLTVGWGRHRELQALLPSAHPGAATRPSRNLASARPSALTLSDPRCGRPAYRCPLARPCRECGLEFA